LLLQEVSELLWNIQVDHPLICSAALTEWKNLTAQLKFCFSLGTKEALFVEMTHLNADLNLIPT